MSDIAVDAGPPSDRQRRPGCLALFPFGLWRDRRLSLWRAGDAGWPRVGGLALWALPAEENRGIPRPLAALIRQHAHRGFFTPLAQDLAGGVQAMGCSTHGPWRHPRLAKRSHLACTGAEGRTRPSTLATPAPALLNSHAQPPSCRSDGLA